MKITLMTAIGLLTVAFMSCDREASLSSYKEFNKAQKVKGEFHVIDSVKLEEEEFFFGSPDFNIRATNYTTALTSMESGQIWGFDEKGALAYHFDVQNTFEGQTGKVLASYDIDALRKAVYVMYIGENTIYQYELATNELLTKVELKMPKDLSLISMPLLKWNNAKELFVVSTGLKDHFEGKEFYEKSKLISVFTKEGEHVSSFGTFPKYFTEVVHFNYWIRYFHSYIDNDNIYLSFGRRPQIYKFDYNGQLLATFGQLSEEFDYKVEKFHPEQPSINQFSDLYYGLTKNENDNVFYYFILDVDKSINHKPEFSYRVLKFNRDANIYTETKVPTHYKLLPSAKGDTLYFYSVDQQYDEKYVVKALLN